MTQTQMIKAMATFIILANARRGGGVSGQAITNFKCGLCFGDAVHVNTSTPLICDDCKKQVREIRDSEEVNL